MIKYQALRGKLSARLAANALVVLALFSASLWGASGVSANHPVLVEGNCLNPPAGNPTVPVAGTCGDYDGDGRIGTAEDMDGDRVFGTITVALNNAATGANQNGSVLIVTSGVFAEVVNITAANGNVTLAAAPGVDADIDAVLQGDPGSAGRQNAPGIVVNAPIDRFVTIRNITSRNWTEGIRVTGDSSVLIDNCRIENNINFGIRVQDNARVEINNTTVAATGYRVSAAGDFPRTATPNPGNGIDFGSSSSGLVSQSLVTGCFGDGISGKSKRNSSNVDLKDVNLFNNNRGGRGDKDDDMWSGSAGNNIK
ncbi:MAG TPA: right-handed parallel beta-helix repeat-containing protein [Blastocatellia bacterium]